MKQIRVQRSTHRPTKPQEIDTRTPSGKRLPY